jgi:hypothetical protein
VKNAAINNEQIFLNAAAEMARTIDRLEKNCSGSLEFASKSIASTTSAIEPLLIAAAGLNKPRILSPVESVISNLQKACRDGQKRSGPIINDLMALSTSLVGPGVISSLTDTSKPVGDAGDAVRSSGELQALVGDKDKIYSRPGGHAIPSRSNERMIEIPALVPPQEVCPALPVVSNISGLSSAQKISLQGDGPRPANCLYSALSIGWNLMQSGSPFFSNAIEKGMPKIISTLETARINRLDGMSPIGQAEGIRSGLAASDFLLSVVYSQFNQNAVIVPLRKEGLYLTNTGIGPRAVESAMQSLSRPKEEATIARPEQNITHFHNNFNIQIHVDHAEELDLKDLGRSIGKILSDELKRYGGIS